jgi:signal transduction histidine kinase/ligand-binding sensor domain-containing protein
MANRLVMLLSGRLFLGIAVLMLTLSGWSQKASNWRAFKLADRLPESACISVTVSPQGKALVRHFSMPLISELDGYGVRSIPAPETGRGRVYQSPGGQLWAVVPEGLQEFKDGTWVMHRVAEVGNESGNSSPLMNSQIAVWPVRQGLVLLLLPDRFLEYNCDDPQRPQTRVLREAKQTRVGQFSGLSSSMDGGLWIAGTRGLAKVPGPLRNLKPETEWTDYLVPSSFQVQNLRGLHEDEDGGVSMVADSSANEQRTVLYFDGRDWTAQTTSSDKLRQAWRSTDKTHWAMATGALFEGEETRAELVENDEISARSYFDVAVQSGTTFWLATSDGLFRYAPPLWRTPSTIRSFISPARCLASDSTGALWFTTGAKVCQTQGEQLRTFSLPPGIGHSLQARKLYVVRSGTVVLALADAEENAGDEFFVLAPGRTEFEGPIPRGGHSRLRALGLLKDGRLCLQSLKVDAGDFKSSLRAFDGQKFEPVTTPVPGDALGTNWHALFLAQNGDWWLSSEEGTALYSDEKWRIFSPTSDKSTPENASWFVELPDGRIWCTAQDAIWEFDGRNWSMVRRGFDRINSMVRSRDGNIWVASNSGLFRYLPIPGAWLENGPEEGLPASAVRDIYEDERGRLWAATSRGLSVFHPEADSDPPRAFVQTFPGPESSLPEGGTISLSFSGLDKWKYTPRERLLYSYRLDVREWTQFQEGTRVYLSDLPAGRHYFQVRAMDRNGNIDAQPARHEFVVVGPWYRETRLVLISCAGAAGALFFAGLAFNRHRQLSRSYAEIERKVAERTKELEIANRELVHSQKMTALGTLAAGIAHDFNNILSIIKGSTQIIEENLANPDKIRSRTDRIKLVVEQGAGIVKAMLGFSRDSGKEPVLCNLNDVVQDTLKLLGDRFLREVQVRFEPAAGLPSVLASKEFIQQILLNFIFNAAESMDSDKLIVLSTAQISELTPDLVLQPLPAARYVVVSVQDSGCGITTENLPRIFEPFFTTKALSTRRGTGLGLSMVYELAKKLGAGLGVVSSVGNGSIFCVILPVRDLPEK